VSRPQSTLGKQYMTTTRARISVDLGGAFAGMGGCGTAYEEMCYGGLAVNCRIADGDAQLRSSTGEAVATPLLAESMIRA